MPLYERTLIHLTNPILLDNKAVSGFLWFKKIMMNFPEKKYLWTSLIISLGPIPQSGIIRLNDWH